MLYFEVTENNALSLKQPIESIHRNTCLSVKQLPLVPKVIFCPLFVFSYKPKTRIRFSTSWWSGNKKYFCFLFENVRTFVDIEIAVHFMISSRLKTVIKDVQK